MSDFSPAAGHFTDAGDDLYGSDNENASASYGDESDSYANEGSQYDSADERSDDGIGADEEDYYDEDEIAAPAPAERRVAAGAVAAQPDALMNALAAQTSVLESLATELSLMRAPTTAMKLTADQIESGIQHRRVKFYIETSLADAAQAGAKNHVRLMGDAKKIFGATQVTISSIDINEIDNRFPVSLAIDAAHLPGEKLRSEPTVINELAMADAVRASRREFGSPLRVYKSTENQFSLNFSKQFKDYNADNLTTDITEVRTAKLLGDKINAPQGPVALVPALNPVMSTIKAAREAQGDVVDEKTFIPHLQAFVVSSYEVTQAVNTIRSSLEASTEATPVEKIYFVMSRSNLTQPTIEKIDAAETNPWMDKAEIGTSLKDGHVKENEFKKVKSLAITATIAYRPL